MTTHHCINRVQHSLKQADLPTPAKDGISFVQVCIFQQYFQTPAGGAELTATQMSEHCLEMHSLALHGNCQGNKTSLHQKESHDLAGLHIFFLRKSFIQKKLTFPYFEVD